MFKCALQAVWTSLYVGMSRWYILFYQLNIYMYIPMLICPDLTMVDIWLYHDYTYTFTNFSSFPSTGAHCQHSPCHALLTPRRFGVLRCKVFKITAAWRAVFLRGSYKKKKRWQKWYWYDSETIWTVKMRIPTSTLQFHLVRWMKWWNPSLISLGFFDD